jgi:hypothetical protein
MMMGSSQTSRRGSLAPAPARRSVDAANALEYR